MTAESGQLSDLIVDDNNALPGDEVGLLLLHADVERLLDLVGPRERRVLRLRFGLDGGRTHTLEEVGASPRRDPRAGPADRGQGTGPHPSDPKRGELP